MQMVDLDSSRPRVCCVQSTHLSLEEAIEYKRLWLLEQVMMVGGLTMGRTGRTGEVLRDIIIGLADGLTVPFALAAGLAGAVSTTLLVVTAGFAEIAAGSIAMALGGYLAVRADRDYYFHELMRRYREANENPDRGRAEVTAMLADWGFKEDVVSTAVETIVSDSDRMVNFIMKHKLRLDLPREGRARESSMTIGFSYIVGGLIPLFPYMVQGSQANALITSCCVTLLALFVFGYVKGKILSTNPWKSAVQTMAVGGLAAAVAYVAAKCIA
jgi:VIT1/CCC1 family predicted Fe2+/Mn2+ transporter